MPSAQDPSFKSLFRRDCEVVICKFCRESSTKFEDFVKVWRELNVYMLLGVKKFIPNIFRFIMDDALQVAKSYFLSPYNFQTRVAALYILYALFMQQRRFPLYKIRITLEQWGDIKKFLSDAQTLGLRDVEFVLRVLILRNAFYFTSFCELSPGDFPELVGNALHSRKWISPGIHISLLPADLNINDIVQQIRCVHIEYEKLKTAFAFNMDSFIEAIRSDFTALRNRDENCMDLCNEVDVTTLEKYDGEATAVNSYNNSGEQIVGKEFWSERFFIKPFHSGSAIRIRDQQPSFAGYLKLYHDLKHKDSHEFNDNKLHVLSGTDLSNALKKYDSKAGLENVRMLDRICVKTLKKKFKGRSVHDDSDNFGRSDTRKRKRAPPCKTTIVASNLGDSEAQKRSEIVIQSLMQYRERKGRDHSRERDVITFSSVNTNTPKRKRSCSPKSEIRKHSSVGRVEQKRRRGRPSKSEKIRKIRTNNAVQKRRPGRPRKTMTPRRNFVRYVNEKRKSTSLKAEASQRSSVDNAGQKRKPGRPRKAEISRCISVDTAINNGTLENDTDYYSSDENDDKKLQSSTNNRGDDGTESINCHDNNDGNGKCHESETEKTIHTRTDNVVQKRKPGRPRKIERHGSVDIAGQKRRVGRPRRAEFRQHSPIDKSGQERGPGHSRNTEITRRISVDSAQNRTLENDVNKYSSDENYHKESQHSTQSPEIGESENFSFHKDSLRSGEDDERQKSESLKPSTAELENSSRPVEPEPSTSPKRMVRRPRKIKKKEFAITRKSKIKKSEEHQRSEVPLNSIRRRGRPRRLVRNSGAVPIFKPRIKKDCTSTPDKTVGGDLISKSPEHIVESHFEDAHFDISSIHDDSTIHSSDSV